VAVGGRWSGRKLARQAASQSWMKRGMPCYFRLIQVVAGGGEMMGLLVVGEVAEKHWKPAKETRRQQLVMGVGSSEILRALFAKT